MSDFEKRLSADLDQGQEYREAYAEAFCNEYLATQIQVLRKQYGWTQAELGQKIGSNQGRVSVYEAEDYGKWSLDTLRKMASVFGVWLKVSFESYGTLIHEAAHFQPQQLARKRYEDDEELRRWIEADVASETKSLRTIRRWAAQDRPDRSVLIGWLQGFGLPEFGNRDATPVQQILESVPGNDERTLSVITGEIAQLLGAQDDEVMPLVRNPDTYRDNLLNLAKALGPRTELQEGLDLVYQRALAKFRNSGDPGLGSDGATSLLEAMIRNQKDGRWEEIWNRYVGGDEHPERLDTSGHPFLPGRVLAGVRGLLGMPPTQEYWKRMARGVRDFERRLIRHGYANLESDPNIMEELPKAIVVIFDWWADPRAAQQLLQGSIDLMDEGSWSMYAQAAWAFAVQRRGWSDAVRSGREDPQQKKYANAMANGLKIYTAWRRAADDLRSGPDDLSEIEKYEREIRTNSLVVIRAA